MYGPYLTTNLRMARLATGIPQFVIAKRARLAASRLSVLERGYDEPSNDERAALSRVLGLSADQLFPVASNNSPSPTAAPGASL